EHARTLGFRLPRPTGRPCAFCAEPGGRTGAVVNADGTLFSCWESVGRPGYEVGTIESGYVDHQPRRWIRGSRSDRDGRFTDAVDAGLLDLIWETRRRKRCAPAPR